MDNTKTSGKEDSRGWVKFVEAVALFSFYAICSYYGLMGFLILLANNGVSGTEFIALYIFPFIIIAPALCVVGFLASITSLLFTKNTKFRYFSAVSSVVLLAASTHQLSLYL